MRVKKAYVFSNIIDHVLRAPRSKTNQDLVAFDDGSVVFVTESDLKGYDSSLVPNAVGTEIWADLSVVYRVGVAGKEALTRISCFWLRCGSPPKMKSNQLGRVSSCAISADHLGGISVDIHVY